MQIELCNELVDVVIVRKNNKNIYLRFHEDLKLYATANRYVSIKEIQNLIINNQKKLEKMYLTAKKQKEQNLQFQYLGKSYIVIYDDMCQKIEFQNDFIITKNLKMLEKFYHQECLRIFTLEVERIQTYFENIPKFSIRIRNMKTRWGVCNRGNNTVTLNSELLKKDLDLLDYVIIHELCHFYEANHSARFWKQVERYYPNYKEARKRLRG